MERLDIEEKISLSNIRFDKSQEMLNDAVENFKYGMYKTSINRSFYAVLHATRSLLILKGADPIRHDGVLTIFSLHFIKPGILPVELAKTFKRLLALRTDVDYGDMETVDKNDAEESLAQAKGFLNSINSMRQQLIMEMTSKG